MTSAGAARAYNRVLAQRDLNNQAVAIARPATRFVNDQGPSVGTPGAPVQVADPIADEPKIDYGGHNYAGGMPPPKPGPSAPSPPNPATSTPGTPAPSTTSPAQNGPVPAGPDQLPQPIVTGAPKPQTVVPDGLPDDLHVTQPADNGGTQSITVVPGTGGQSYDAVITNPDGSTTTARVVSDGEGGATIWATLPDGTHSVTYVSAPDAEGKSTTENYSYLSSVALDDAPAVTVGDGEGLWDRQKVGPDGTIVTSHVEVQSDGITYNETTFTPDGGSVTVAFRPGSPDFQEPWTVGVRNPDGSGWFNGVTGTQATFGTDAWGQRYEQEYDPVNRQIVTRVVKNGGADDEWVELIISDLNGGNEARYRVLPDGKLELLWRRVDTASPTAIQLGAQPAEFDGRNYFVRRNNLDGYDLQFDDGARIRLNAAGQVIDEQAAPDTRSLLDKTGEFFSNLGSGIAEWGSNLTSMFRLGADIRAAGNPLNPTAAAAAEAKYQRILQANGATANFAYSMLVEPVVNLGKYAYYHSMSGMMGVAGASAGGTLTPQGRAYGDYATDLRDQAPSTAAVAFDLALTFIPVSRLTRWIGGVGKRVGSAAITKRADETREAVESWIAAQVEPRFELTYSLDQIREVVAHGFRMGVDDATVSDMIKIGSRIAKPISQPELMVQMTNWRNVVSIRGFPYKFSDRDEFTRFGYELKEGLAKVGLPSGDTAVQGSALRTPRANDVDIAVFVEKSVFDDLLVRYFDGKVAYGTAWNAARSPVPLAGLSRSELEALAMDIRLNRHFYNSQARTFENAITHGIISSKSKVSPGLKQLAKQLGRSYPHLNIDAVSLLVRGSSFDTRPALRIR